MDEYISREAVLQTLQKANIGGYITERLLEIPAADVQPVKHGRWIAENRDNRGYADCYTCTNCNCYSYTYTLMKECDYDYCPVCGARMGGDSK